MERILGLDLGSRTCGIAISDTLGMLAHGIETYRFEMMIMIEPQSTLLL